MKLCFKLQIFVMLMSSALLAQSALEDLPEQPASSFHDAIKLSRDLQKLRSREASAHETFTLFRPIPTLAARSQRRSPNDLIIGQINPNEVVTITGSYVLPGNLIIMNNGVLNLDHADFQIDGNITILNNGRLNVTGGAFTVLQDYLYEHGAGVWQKGRLHFNGVDFRSNGQSWGLSLADSARYILEDSKISDGFITTGLSGRASGIIRNTQTPGEFLCFEKNDLQFHGCDFVLLWLVLFDSSAVDMSLPSDALLNGWRFSATIPGVSGIPYTVAIDSCTNVNWGLISFSGSKATFRNTHFRVAGLAFQQPDSIVVQNLTNGSTHADEVIAAPDRTLRLINSKVATWNFYPAANSKLTIQNCIFGEMLAQGSARVLIDNSICDGSGGYVGAFDQSFTVIFRSLMTTQVISGGNGILVSALSAFNSTEINADESSIMVILNTSTLVEPEAHAAALILEGQLPPVEGLTESEVAITGTARMLAGPLNPIRLVGYRVEYAQEVAPRLWRPTDGFHAQAVVNDTLALWNTAGLMPGPYALRLTMLHSFGDSLSFDSFARLEQSITGVQSRENLAPQQFALAQNYPNPFNPSTVISFQLPVNSHVTLRVFDVNGREVATLVEGEFNAGAHKVIFDATGLPNGVYFYRIKTKSSSQTRKAVLLR